MSDIRLGEVDWGGVPPNGIPPLRYPDHIPADEADYLDDGDIVFGIEVAGEARACPKRILAWHEMAIDGVGGVDLTIVYCKLCGTVIPYENVVDGRHIRFGTSGLLYRSNKLMFDEATKSLWSTLEGRPVVGSLVGSGLELTRRSMVTSESGASRVYESAEGKFEEALDDQRVRSDDGLIWLVTEDELVVEGDSTLRLARMPHRAFWFGWYAQFPQTVVFD